MVDALFNHALRRDWVCAQCEGELIEICDEGEWKVVCSQDHSHEGKIRRSTVELRRQQEQLEGIEIEMNYRELLPPRPGCVAKDLEDLGF